MQPLVPVDHSLDSASNGLLFVGSSTLKTVAINSEKWQLHIALGNVLYALSHSSELIYFYICRFEDGKVNRYELMNGDSVKVHVEHGDVIFMDLRGKFASFISEEFHCTCLAAKERFEYIKSFFYEARHSKIQFAAIVENDGHEEPKGPEVKVEMNGEARTRSRWGTLEEELQES